MKTGTPRTTRTIEMKITEFAERGLVIDGIIKPTLGMVLAAAIKPEAGLIAFAIDATPLSARDKTQYDKIELAGQRLQHFAAPSVRTRAISGAKGIVRIATTILGQVIQGFVKTLETMTGKQTGNVYFTDLLGNEVETVVTSDGTRFHSLADHGFTGAVPFYDALASFVGVRGQATDETARRCLHALGVEQANAGRWTDGWIQSNPLNDQPVGLPLRVTAQNIKEVPVVIRTADGQTGQVLVDIGDIVRGKIVALADEVRAQIAGQGYRVLGETSPPTHSVFSMHDGTTAFVPAQSFRAAVEQGQQAQI